MRLFGAPRSKRPDDNDHPDLDADLHEYPI